ncbi:alkaline phosphatase family protein [Pseudenhygromyxa sp. WMMC2535]|uniref:alkaline phosphatase family protein n=1 Tax=Pseudenhygromyxa sp. WMMC2535 TaxID=2712867 RepID=UPI001556CD2A|nr:alkaline phosphatase family protein [Pseudenhygromyxa sp. WMMC2535]
MSHRRAVPAVYILTLALAGPLACKDKGSEGEAASGSAGSSSAAQDSAGPEPGASEPETNQPGTSEPGASEPAAPKLVVLVVVDQMRYDNYARLDEQWTGGLHRLGAEGRFYTEARHVHALTETGPGHATLTTGMHPAHHGVIANNWFDRALGRKINVVEDPEAPILGHEDDEDSEGASPRKLLREAVGDWLHAASPKSQVISISLKDRAAILMGGQRPDAAIWYDDPVGAYTSSRYYYPSSDAGTDASADAGANTGDEAASPAAQALPRWVSAFNERGRAEKLYGEQGWQLSHPIPHYASSRADTDEALVATFNGYGLTTRFPHQLSAQAIEAGKGPRNVIRDTPFGDQMTLELASEAIEALELGTDEHPDLLMISMSGGDYTGHRYGPHSVETHDFYLRLDQALGDFLEALEGRVGAENVVVVLTGDHGGGVMPEHAPADTMPKHGRFVAKEAVPPMLDAAMAAAGLGAKQRPELAFAEGVVMRFPAAASEDDRKALRAALAEQLRAHEQIADAWTADELTADPPPTRPYTEAWIRSYNPERSADILFQVEKGVYVYAQGAGHGTPYEYDQHVPLIFWGPATWVSPGKVTTPVRTVDLAPTMAGLLAAPIPADLDGAGLPLK